jgi:hypothetical protein
VSSLSVRALKSLGHAVFLFCASLSRLVPFLVWFCVWVISWLSRVRGSTKAAERRLLVLGTPSLSWCCFFFDVFSFC